MRSKLWHNVYFEIRKWWGYMPPPTKIWLSNMREGSVYEIRARLYKIVRNASKFTAQILFWNSKMAGPPSKIWTSNTRQAEGVRNWNFGVQNCKKCVQNYGKMFILKFENGGATCLHPLYQNWNGEYWVRAGCTKFELSCTKLWHNLYFEIRKCWGFVLLPPKFEFRISGKGWVYEIGDRLY